MGTKVKNNNDTEIFGTEDNKYKFYEYPEYTFDKKYDNDEYQKAVISLDSGYHLVLAPPGCGKTDILAERVARALSRGIELDKMLCLTFTNRAARGMRSRIVDRLDYQGEMGLFVGNIHRFCSHFLFENNVVAKSSTVMEEDDSLEIVDYIIHHELNDEINTGYYDSAESYEEQFLKEIPKLQHILALADAGCPKEIMPNLDLFLRHYFNLWFQVNQIPFSFEYLAKIYRGEIDLNTMQDSQLSVGKMLISMLKVAMAYRRYKEENNLLDFDDLLTITYGYAKAHKDELRKYSWIQIDEVQDLSPLQFAIVDFFTEDSDNSITVYLGDEQQAIFSFIGAKLSTLEWLRKRCDKNMHRLYFNYRSPKYLLDIFNQYANMELDVDPSFLPKTNNFTNPEKNALVITSGEDKDEEISKVGDIVKAMITENPDERVAVLVPWNKDANEISEVLRYGGIEHFKISGTDIFTTPEVQFLLAHFQVLYNEANVMAWSRIMAMLRIYSSQSHATFYLKKMRENFLSPTDFLREDGSTYMQQLYECYKGEYIIYDTETTGLNVFEDDIVQIAAIKIKEGEIVERFNIILNTEKEIPAMLGDIPNPLIEEYKKADRVIRVVGLNMFLDFCQELPLIGHNIEYDYNILDNNLKRDCHDYTFIEKHPIYFDTLKVARLTAPRLKKYRLKFLLEYFNLEGENSHLADDDIIATKSVLDYCIRVFSEKISEHKAILGELHEKGEDLRSAYSELYNGTKQLLYKQQNIDQSSVLVNEMKRAYQYSLDKEWMNEVKKLQYILNFFEEDVIDVKKYPSLRQQLEAYILDMTTYREADLCESSSVKEKVFVSTVHKAKGLEFETVILFEATDGVYPHFARTTPEDIKESARLFYVGLTRAKKRLYITYCNSISGISRWGNPYCMEKEPTPFLRHIKKSFKSMEP